MSKFFHTFKVNKAAARPSERDRKSSNFFRSFTWLRKETLFVIVFDCSVVHLCVVWHLKYSAGSRKVKACGLVNTWYYGSLWSNALRMCLKVVASFVQISPSKRVKHHLLLVSCINFWHHTDLQLYFM